MVQVAPEPLERQPLREPPDPLELEQERLEPLELEQERPEQERPELLALLAQPGQQVAPMAHQERLGLLALLAQQGLGQPEPGRAAQPIAPRSHLDPPER